MGAKKPIAINGKVYTSRQEAAEALGMEESTLNARLADETLSMERVINLPVRGPDGKMRKPRRKFDGKVPEVSGNLLGLKWEDLWNLCKLVHEGITKNRAEVFDEIMNLLDTFDLTQKDGKLKLEIALKKLLNSLIEKDKFKMEYKYKLVDRIVELNFQSFLTLEHYVGNISAAWEEEFKVLLQILDGGGVLKDDSLKTNVRKILEWLDRFGTGLGRDRRLDEKVKRELWRLAEDGAISYNLEDLLGKWLDHVLYRRPSQFEVTTLTTETEEQPPPDPDPEELHTVIEKVQESEFVVFYVKGVRLINFLAAPWVIGLDSTPSELGKFKRESFSTKEEYNAYMKAFSEMLEDETVYLIDERTYECLAKLEEALRLLKEGGTTTQ